MSDSEAQKQQAELNHLESTISDEAQEQGQPQDSVVIDTEKRIDEGAAIWTPVIKMGLDYKAPNWKTTEEEIQPMSTALSAVINKYFPDTDVFDKLKEELSLGFAVYMFVMAKRGIPLIAEPEVESNAEA